MSLEIDSVTNMARAKGFDFGIAICFRELEFLKAFDKHAACERCVIFESPSPSDVRKVFVCVACRIK
jgi:hypothetical protein